MSQYKVEIKVASNFLPTESNNNLIYAIRLLATELQMDKQGKGEFFLCEELVSQF